MNAGEKLELVLRNGRFARSTGRADLYQDWYRQAENALSDYFGLHWKDYVLWEGYNSDEFRELKERRLDRAIDCIEMALGSPQDPTTQAEGDTRPETAVPPQEPVDAGDRRKIVVLSALYEESEPVWVPDAVKRRPGPTPLQWRREKLASLDLPYRVARLSDTYDLAAITLNRMGLVDASILASAVFEELKPDLAAMVGICAGRQKKGARLGHIVVPSNAFHYQFGKRTEQGLEPKLRNQDTQAYFINTAEEIGAHSEFDKWMNEDHPDVLKPRNRCELHTGGMASADYVAAWSDLLQQAARLDNDVMGLDMESYAFMQAAFRSGREVPAFVVKCVVDYADEDKDDEVRYWACTAAVRFYFLMLARWLDDASGTTYWQDMTQ